MYNLFNHHKIKRKWGRGFKKASDFLLSSSVDEFNPRQDFAWHNSKANPLWHGNQKKDWKKRLEIVILTFCAVGMVGIGLYSDFFKIKTVEVEGLERISEAEFKNAVLGIIGYRKLFIFPGQNYFIVDLNEIRDILKERFPLESIVVKKSFPKMLEISIEEKISNLIYDNGKQYSYLDTTGKMVEIIRQVGQDEWIQTTEVVTSTNEKGELITEIKVIDQSHTPSTKTIVKEMGNYPIVYDKRGVSGQINDQVILNPVPTNIIRWFNFLNKETDIPFNYIMLEDDLGNCLINTREGWYIKVKINTPDIESQLVELQYVLKHKIERTGLQYIDLRFLGKVYWQ